MERIVSKKFHFIAIGGVGMSGLAKFLIQQGYTVSGSDVNDSKYVKQLKEMGATVYIGHSKDNVPKDATVIVSSAIRETNPELKHPKLPFHKAVKKYGYSAFRRITLKVFDTM